MCLKLSKENANAKIADHDIVCYKLMYGYCDDNGNVGIVSPYQNTRHPFNKTIAANGKVVKDYWNEMCDFLVIGKGVIHSYSFLEGAMDDMENYFDGNIIFKAIIPKGTKYYVGDFCGIPAFGSKKLIITDTIVGVHQPDGDEGIMLADYLSDNFKMDYCTISE